MNRDQVKALAEQLCNPLPGWCKKEKRDALVDSVFMLHEELKRPLTIVEIGVFGGSSFGALVTAAGYISSVVYGIDPWSVERSTEHMIDKANLDWWSKIDHGRMYLDVVDLFASKSSSRVLRMTSAEAAKYIHVVDLIHIDGNHSEEKSVFDVQTWIPKVTIGGFVWMDDIDWHEAGVCTTLAACKLLEAHCELLQTIKIPGINACGLFRKVR
jgi:hypothetical protein